MPDAENGPGAGYPYAVGRGKSALDDMLWALSEDRRALYRVLDEQPVDAGFLARATATGPRAGSDARELLVDFSAEVRARAVSALSGAKAGFPADEAAGLLSKMGRGAQSAMASIVSNAAHGKRGALPRDLSVASALAEAYMDGYLLAYHPAAGQRLDVSERSQARKLARLLFGEDGHPVDDVWSAEDGTGGPGRAWEGPGGAAGPLPGEDDALRAGVAEARAEALARELAAARDEAARASARAREAEALLEVLHMSGNISFETPADAVAFAAEALPDRLAFSREARDDAAAYAGDAEDVWRAVRALAFDFQPEAALGRPPVEGFAAKTGYDLSPVGGQAPAPSFTGRIGRVQSAAGYVLEEPAGGLKVYFSVLTDGRVGVVRCGRRAAHGTGS